jgi:hypothetical protein
MGKKLPISFVLGTLALWPVVEVWVRCDAERQIEER